MSNIRKLSAFRQLSLNCNSTEQRRKTLKKQFSEDLPDSWLDPLTISLDSKARNFDRPPPIKIAWEDAELKTEEAVIIKRCKEVRRASTGKLSRQSSLDKDSILHSKQEITERLRQHVESKGKGQEKRNLKIFLAPNSYDHKEVFFQTEKDSPKLIQPLIANHAKTNTKNLFKIHRNRHKIDLHEIAYSPTRSKPTITRNDTVVVENPPIVENNPTDTSKEEIKPIDSVIIRPATAASRREKFQKRSNSAFTTTIRESPARPVLVRSSSATVRPEHGKSKFLATRRKIRSAKRSAKSVQRGDGVEGGAANEGNPTAAEIVTMVSLVSPAGSDVEEVTLEVKEKSKGRSAGGNTKTKEEVEVQRNASMRKTVKKSVSFQQSSIHAVRSFSASFPARRTSMATAFMLVNDAKNVPPGPQGPTTGQEKRGTNANLAHDDDDDDESVPKRRLIRSATENKIDSCQLPEVSTPSQLTDEDEKSPTDVNFTIDIKTKDASQVVKPPDVEEIPKEENPGETPPERAKQIKNESPNEKQCWELHRKMTEKGINVSLDTILRGMLTPTEYRLSRQNSIAAALLEEITDPDDVAL